MHLLQFSLFGIFFCLILSCQQEKFHGKGKYDLQTNGIWISHAWLGDDLWFERYDKDTTIHRSDDAVLKLYDILKSHHIQYVYPHTCPAEPDGSLPGFDDDQYTRFTRIFEDFKIIPWIGGVLFKQCFPDSIEWRNAFTGSVEQLMINRPELHGVHLNIEPLPSGNPGFLELLDEIKVILPPGKILSVAAYPPPTRWQLSDQVHWRKAYFEAVASRADQVVPMMYDTSIKDPDDYKDLMIKWTNEVLLWSGESEVLLGVPAYADTGKLYHYPHVENLENALEGIYKALNKERQPPDNYAGISIYSEWTMDSSEWKFVRENFNN